MRFMVMVPVLSEQITDDEPRVSIEGRWRTIALLLTIFCTPRASVSATTAGSPSGIAATARLIAVLNVSRTSSPESQVRKKIRNAAPITTSARRREKWLSFCSRGLLWLSSSPDSSSAIRPSSVCIAVATITALALPLATTVPE